MLVVYENLCATCGAAIDTSMPMTTQEYRRKSALIIMGSPIFGNIHCPNGCHSTYRDCNINTKSNLRRPTPEERAEYTKEQLAKAK